MSVHIFYGSSTGNAESAANAMVKVFAESDDAVELHDMMDGEFEYLEPTDFHVFSCATYGDGELPAGTSEFFEELLEAAPDLSGLRFAVFGLGDSIYEDTFNNGGKTVVKHLTGLGATQVGERYEHDNSGTDFVTEKAVEWAKGIVSQI